VALVSTQVHSHSGCDALASVVVVCGVDFVVRDVVGATAMHIKD
jgi:hypothetical protein